VRTTVRVPERAAGCGIEAGGRFVKEDDLGVVDECEGDGEALPLTAGEFADRRVALLFEGEAGEQFVRVGAVGVEAGEHVEGLPDGEIVDERDGLELNADALFDGPGVARNIDAEDADGAGGRLAEALDHFEGGGLAGAVGSEDAEDLPFFDGEGDAVNGYGVLVALGQIGNDNSRHPRHHPLYRLAK
jgi:hypothetical protein